MNRFDPFPASSHDRRLGALLGLAIGDALGAATEFKGRGSFPPVTTYRKGCHPIEPGGWTDDTAMAVALGISLKSGFDLQDQADHYVGWRSGNPIYNPDGRFDIGGQTASAISMWNNSQRIDINPKSQGLGNGSIMRLAPAAAYGHERCVPGCITGDLCALSSVVTHPAQLCQDTCRIMGTLLFELFDADYLNMDSVKGMANTEIVDLILGRHFDYWDLVDGRIIHPKLMELLRVPPPADKTPSNAGHVFDTFQAAIWCWRTTDSFEAAVLKAANMGGDADSIGAVTGQLAGAFYGAASFPDHLVDGLLHKATLANAWLHLVKESYRNG